ncbi:hypothetical protein CEXT_304701, partial [Caerostris extrusa]
MERDATMDYPFGKVHQERVIRTYGGNVCGNTIGAVGLAYISRKKSNLSDEERCARISTVIKKKDIAQNLYDAYAAALTGYSPDDDDLKDLKIRHDISSLQWGSAMLPILIIMNMKMTVLLCPPKKFIAKVNCAKNPQHLVETKNSFGKLIVDEQEEQDSDTTPRVKKMPPIM